MLLFLFMSIFILLLSSIFFTIINVYVKYPRPRYYHVMVVIIVYVIIRLMCRGVNIYIILLFTNVFVYVKYRK